MILAGLFAGILCLGLILGDWLYFVRLTPGASRYGCGVARTQDRFTQVTMAQLYRSLRCERPLDPAAWDRAVLSFSR